VQLEGEVGLSTLISVSGGLVGASATVAYFSADGQKWSVSHDPAPYAIQRALSGTGEAILIDNRHTRKSSDGINWTVIERDYYYSFMTMIADGNGYLGVMGSILMTSQDGAKYHRFVPVGNGLREIWFLDDGGRPTTISNLYCFDGTYYALGEKVWRSTDLSNWEVAFAGQAPATGLSQMYYNGTNYLLQNFYYVFTFDGTDVARLDLKASRLTVDDSGRFVAVNTADGTTYVSSDGHQWTELFGPAGHAIMVYDIAVHDGKLILSCEKGNIYYRQMEY
jgi:hypothetical protein